MADANAVKLGIGEEVQNFKLCDDVNNECPVPHHAG